jgi:hypothetical protein
LQRRFDKDSRRVKVDIVLEDAISISADDPRDIGLEELAGRAKKK